MTDSNTAEINEAVNGVLVSTKRLADAANRYADSFFEEPGTPMTTFDLIQALAKYPPSTRVVLSFNWEAPKISEAYLEKLRPTLALHSGELDV